MKRTRSETEIEDVLVHFDTAIPVRFILTELVRTPSPSMSDVVS